MTTFPDGSTRPVCTLDDIQCLPEGTDLKEHLDNQLACVDAKYPPYFPHGGRVPAGADRNTNPLGGTASFEDGAVLGSYNTQQHWLAHADGLFLVYTRRGAKNDHIVRHRAPLFIARVDPEKLHVLRATERVLIAERGAELGNFGAAAINENESWVTVAEGVWSDAARERGAEGAVFVARVLWSRPNRPATGGR